MKAEPATPANDQLPPEVIERIRTGVQQRPGKMTLQLAHELNIPEVAVVRALPEGWVTELDAGRWEELIRAFADLGQVHVIVSNGGATLEAVGQFGNFSSWNEFFNVQTQSLDMHIRWPALGAAFTVEKPSHMNGVNTLSVQFFDRAGHAAFKVFLNFGGAVSTERAEQFTQLRERFRKPA